ncbi:MAG: RNA polymerase sigma factor [Lachnospiraceae bacterium]
MTKKKFCDYIYIYKRDLYIIASAILKNSADAEDAVSNAILKGYENLDQLRDVRKFKPWMLMITKNEALKLKKKRLELPGNEMVEAMLKPTQDRYDELWDVIRKMKEEYRLVVVLFYYEDLSIRDISGVLNIPLGTVKSRLNRGKEELKQALKYL